MVQIKKTVEEVTGIRHESIPEDILTSTEPLVLKGLVSEWPMVQAAQVSNERAIEYILQYYENATVDTLSAAPELSGRFFYNEDISDFNFQRGSDKLDSVLQTLLQYANNANSPSLYVGSTTVDVCLPGFRDENDLGLGDISSLVSIWIGNQSRIAAHHDLPDNIACVVVGKRRFTLFPPEQIENLYVGPIDFNPAGQAISLVDLHNPDFDRYPKFRKALEAAQVAHLEPGDALFLPSMWWHQVESLTDLNVLINYWWRQSPAYMGPPINVLHHALLAIRELPKEQRAAWKKIFDYYIFESDEETLSHIPEKSLASLGPLTEQNARKLRALLLNKLNR